MIGKHSVCLSMIVKDEAHVIRRCLQSVLPYIDAWVVVDTGSTDGTQEIVWEVLGDLPGELLERPWQDFATGRNQALLPALTRADYALVLDADEELVVEPCFQMTDAPADSYILDVRMGGSTHTRRALLRSGIDWAWKGVLHEYPHAEAATTNVRLRGMHIVARIEGARSKDPDKFAKDAQVLLRGIADEPENDRYRFYLGQTYRDGGRYEEAIAAYEDHLAMPTGWEEERWYSRLAIAWCKDKLDHPWPEVQDAYLAAYAQKPERAEPLYYLAMKAIEQDRIAVADLLLRRAYECVVPLTAPLFVDRVLYTTIIPAEYSFTCFRMGRFQGALGIVNRLLAGNDLEPAMREALLDNQAEILAVMAAQPRVIPDAPDGSQPGSQTSISSPSGNP